jgi:hypothetical protein
MFNVPTTPVFRDVTPLRWVGPLTVGTRSRHVPSKRPEPLTQRLSVISHKTGIADYTAVKTVKLHMLDIRF